MLKSALDPTRPNICEVLDIKANSGTYSASIYKASNVKKNFVSNTASCF
jgi:hypothetical protein